MLAAADDQALTGARRALEELIKIYWFPLYAYIRRRGSSPEQAEDLTQGFFARMLEKESLYSVDRGKGKFRSFLLASLKNFMSDERDKARAKKRGGGKGPLSLDALDAEAHYAMEPVDSMTPERLFERRWAIAVLDQVVLRLEKEYSDRGQGAMFKALRHALDGQADGPSYAALAGRLGASEGALRVAAHRLRRRYRELLRQEILQTVSAPELVDEEIRYLLRCL